MQAQQQPSTALVELKHNHQLMAMQERIIEAKTATMLQMEKTDKAREENNNLWRKEATEHRLKMKELETNGPMAPVYWRKLHLLSGYGARIAKNLHTLVTQYDQELHLALEQIRADDALSPSVKAEQELQRRVTTRNAIAREMRNHLVANYPDILPVSTHKKRKASEAPLTAAKIQKLLANLDTSLLAYKKHKNASLEKLKTKLAADPNNEELQENKAGMEMCIASYVYGKKKQRRQLMEQLKGLA